MGPITRWTWIIVTTSILIIHLQTRWDTRTHTSICSLPSPISPKQQAWSVIYVHRCFPLWMVCLSAMLFICLLMVVGVWRGSVVIDIVVSKWWIKFANSWIKLGVEAGLGELQTSYRSNAHGSFLNPPDNFLTWIMERKKEKREQKEEKGGWGGQGLLIF